MEVRFRRPCNLKLYWNTQVRSLSPSGADNDFSGSGGVASTALLDLAFNQAINNIDGGLI